MHHTRQVPETTYQNLYQVALTGDMSSLARLLNTEDIDLNHRHAITFVERATATVANWTRWATRILSGGTMSFGGIAVAGAGAEAAATSTAATATALETGAAAGGPAALALGGGIVLAFGAAGWYIGEASLRKASLSTEGWGALHFAAAGGHVKAANTLITHGACPKIKDAAGLSIFEIAHYFGHKDFAVEVVSLALERDKQARRDAAKQTACSAEAAARAKQNVLALSKTVENTQKAHLEAEQRANDAAIRESIAIKVIEMALDQVHRERMMPDDQPRSTWPADWNPDRQPAAAGAGAPESESGSDKIYLEERLEAFLKEYADTINAQRESHEADEEASEEALPQRQTSGFFAGVFAPEASEASASGINSQDTVEHHDGPAAGGGGRLGR